jgi:hypothetical protein
MKTLTMLGLALGLLLWTGGSSSAQVPLDEASLVTRTHRLAERVNASRTTGRVMGEVTVVGFVWQRDDLPVEYPRLRIRDLRNGEIAGRTVGSAAGEFRFDQLAGGLYLIELVEAGDRLLAVGQPLDVVSGETVGTFIRLGGAGVFGLSAGLAGIDRFGGALSQVVDAGTTGGISPIGGGNATSNER